MDYTLVKIVIELVEAFQQNHPSNKVEDFTIWLNTELFSSTTSTEHSVENDLLITFKLMYLAKELKKLTKSVFADSKISTTDDYSFLLHLNLDQTFRKMELIEMHNLEAPTGTEIIKRLLKNGLIEEYPDELDKRAKRVRITAAGKDEIARLEPTINNVFRKISEPLNLNEKVQFSGILDKLIH